MIYFDAAYIAKCYLNEPGTDKVIALAERSDGLCSCEFGRLEFFSVLHRHLRQGHLARRHISRVVKNFELDEKEGVWHWLPVTSGLLRDICARVGDLPKDVLLRAGDALHLGCASENGFKEIYTSDSYMLACAPHFDLAGINVLSEVEAVLYEPGNWRSLWRSA